MSSTVIILPAYNEAARIATTLESILAVPELHEASIVVIDDGSQDETAAIVRSYAHVQLIQHHINKGLGKVFLTAVDHALHVGAETMVLFDADNQFTATDVPTLLQPIRQKRANVVLGSRFIQGRPQGISRAKLFGNVFLAWFVSRVTHCRLHDVACGLRAYDREALLRVSMNSKFTYTQEVLLDLLFKGLTIIEVPITVRYDAERVSTISSNLWKYGWRVFKIIVRTVRDYKPMKFFSTIGLVVFLVGVGAEVWLLLYYARVGGFTPYKFIGFIGLALNVFGLLFWIIGFVMDMFNRQRFNQDEALYLLRKLYYK